MDKLPIDIVFVIDTTGSMGNFIAQAKRFMKDALGAVAKQKGLDIFVSIIEYRDHPPEERSFASRITACKEPLNKFDGIDKLSLGNGGDTAESGLDGIIQIENLRLSPDYMKIAFLIGDAPFHGTPEAKGYSRGRFIDKCACGLTVSDIIKSLEKTGIELHGISLAYSSIVLESFSHVCSDVQRADSNIIQTISKRIYDYATIYSWSKESLLPKLQSNPRAEVSELSKQLFVPIGTINTGIEILNSFGFTNELNLT